MADSFVKTGVAKPGRGTLSPLEKVEYNTKAPRESFKDLADMARELHRRGKFFNKGGWLDREIQAASLALRSKRQNSLFNTPAAPRLMGEIMAIPFAKTERGGSLPLQETLIDHGKLDREIEAFRRSPGVIDARKRHFLGSSRDVLPGEDPRRRINIPGQVFKKAPEVFSLPGTQEVLNNLDDYGRPIARSELPRSPSVIGDVLGNLDKSGGRYRANNAFKPTELASKASSAALTTPKLPAEAFKPKSRMSNVVFGGRYSLVKDKPWTADLNFSFGTKKSGTLRPMLAAGAGLLAFAGAGLALAGAAQTLPSRSNEPAELALSGPIEGFGEEDMFGIDQRSGGQVTQSPRSYSTVGPMSPNRMGATGDLTLAMHKNRRG